jgi:hypothetical protein
LSVKGDRKQVRTITHNGLAIADKLGQSLTTWCASTSINAIASKPAENFRASVRVKGSSASDAKDESESDKIAF